MTFPFDTEANMNAEIESKMDDLAKAVFALVPVGRSTTCKRIYRDVKKRFKLEVNSYVVFRSLLWLSSVGVVNRRPQVKLLNGESVGAVADLWGRES